MTNPHFWNRMAKRYAKMPVQDPISYQEKLRRIRGYLTPELHLLEVGCGTGSTALALSPHCGSILAIDYAEKMIEIAEQKARDKRVENVRFRAMSFDDLPSNPYDMVLAMNVLQLMPDPGDALTQLTAMVKPGGMIVTSTLCVKDTLPPARFLVKLLGAAGVLPTIIPFSRNELLSMFDGAGLTLLESWHPSRMRPWFDIAQRPIVG